MAKKPPDPYSYGDFADWKEPKVAGLIQAILCGAPCCTHEKSFGCLRLKRMRIIPGLVNVYILLWKMAIYSGFSH